MLVVYHLESCSKSRGVLEKLESKGLDFKVIEYISEPLSKEELASLHQKMSDTQASELCRKELPENSTDEDIYTFLADNPEALQRPILVFENEAIIGRPIEKVDVFLEKIVNND